MKEYEYLDELISRYPVLAPVKDVYKRQGLLAQLQPGGQGGARQICDVFKQRYPGNRRLTPLPGKSH